MVSYSEVLESNNSLKSHPPGLVAIFVGATSGVGLGALKALTKHTTSPTIFIVGRSSSALSTIIADLQSINSTATFHPIECADLSLLSNVNDVYKQITSHPAAPTKVDILSLSPGYLAVRRTPTTEGLDKLTAIRYYARMRLVVLLLPLLRAAPEPRVVCVLAGGKEGTLWPGDFLLEKHYSLPAAAGAAASMLTLFMEELAAKPENEKVVFVHLFPGVVTDTKQSSFAAFGPVLGFLVGWILMGVILRPFCYRSEEAGERVLFAATSERFRRLTGQNEETAEGVSKGSDGKVGSGVYLVQANSDTVEASQAGRGGNEFKEMRAQGMGGKLWDHTMDVFQSTAH